MNGSFDEGARRRSVNLLGSFGRDKAVLGAPSSVCSNPLERDPYTGDLLALFCSVRCPGDVILKTYDLARALRNADVTIIGGFQSPMEKECLTFLLRGTARVIVCPARGIGRMRVPAEWKKPLAEGRLLVLSFFDDGVRRATRSLAQQRNDYVAAIAHRFMIAHAAPGSRTEALAVKLLQDRRAVFTLESADNANLIDHGAIPIAADDPSPLLAATAASTGNHRRR